MKVLIATGWVGAWPYLPEMVEEFQRRGVHADVFDIGGPMPMLAEKIAFRAPILRHSLNTGLLKRRLARFPADYDGVNIHFAAPIYRYLAQSLKRKGKRLVTSIWGSDFLRATPRALDDLDRTLSASHIVTTNNPVIRQRLLARFPEIESRLRIVPFGLRSLDIIRELMNSETREDSRRRLGLPINKTIVTVGYNGIRQQQHAIIIAGLAALAPQNKARLFALVPMTYPDDAPYQAEVEVLLKASGVDFAIVRDKLDIRDNCRIRIASDYAINMQTTDSLSASIQEHMFSGSRLVVGKWLPYEMFERMGVPILKVNDARDIVAALEATDIDRAGPERPAYAEQIYKHSSWNATIGQWMDLYRPGVDRQ